MGFGLRVSGFEFRDSGFGLRVSGFRFRVSGFRFWVSGFGFRDSDLNQKVSAILCKHSPRRAYNRTRLLARKVDVGLPEKRNSNSHGARPVHLIITMTKCIRTRRLSRKDFLCVCCTAARTHHRQQKSHAFVSTAIFQRGFGYRVSGFGVRVQTGGRRQYHTRTLLPAHAIQGYLAHEKLPPS